MALRKPQSLIEALRVDTRVMGEQLDQTAFLGARFRYRPLHKPLADTAAAAVRGDANILDQSARGSLRTQTRHHAELQAADHRTTLLRDHELDIGIRVKSCERVEVG